MKNFATILLMILTLLYTNPVMSTACTEVRVKARDNSVVIGRSMEFAQEVNSNIIVQPRGDKRTSKLADGSPGKSWTSKYGLVYLDGFGLDIVADGMNEKGLTVGALYFPDLAEYQKVTPGKESRAVSNIDLGMYILQNFATVDEVKANLPEIIVWGQKLEVLDNIVVPLHYSVYQEDGTGIIIEYSKEGLTIYDSVGVLTNSPAYSWHVTNIQNYVNLTADNIKPVVIDGISFAATGQGSGLKGIPGDPTPPSRFIRVAAMGYLSNKVNTATDTVNLVAHIMNNVDIPIGIVRDFESGQVFHDYTQWVVIKDLAQKIMYFRSYNDLTIKGVDLNKFDISEKGQRVSMPVMTKENGLVDVSADLKSGG